MLDDMGEFTKNFRVFYKKSTFEDISLKLLIV